MLTTNLIARVIPAWPRRLASTMTAYRLDTRSDQSHNHAHPDHASTHWSMEQMWCQHSNVNLLGSFLRCCPNPQKIRELQILFCLGYCLTSTPWAEIGKHYLRMYRHHAISFRHQVLFVILRHSAQKPKALTKGPFGNSIFSMSCTYYYTNEIQIVESWKHVVATGGKGPWQSVHF